MPYGRGYVGQATYSGKTGFRHRKDNDAPPGCPEIQLRVLLNLVAAAFEGLYSLEESQVFGSQLLDRFYKNRHYL